MGKLSVEMRFGSRKTLMRRGWSSESENLQVTQLSVKICNIMEFVGKNLVGFDFQFGTSIKKMLKKVCSRFVNHISFEI